MALRYIVFLSQLLSIIAINHQSCTQYYNPGPIDITLNQDIGTIVIKNILEISFDLKINQFCDRYRYCHIFSIQDRYPLIYTYNYQLTAEYKYNSSYRETKSSSTAYQIIEDRDYHHIYLKFSDYDRIISIDNNTSVYTNDFNRYISNDAINKTKNITAVWGNPVGFQYITDGTIKNICIRSLDPTSSPTNVPTSAPTTYPTLYPTNFPTDYPSKSPTYSPSISPTMYPTDVPTTFPTMYPTNFSTDYPSKSPSNIPSISPTNIPSISPTSPTTHGPTLDAEFPTKSPMIATISTNNSISSNVSTTATPPELKEAIKIDEHIVVVMVVIIASLCCIMIAGCCIRWKYKNKKRDKIYNERYNHIDNNYVELVDVEENTIGIESDSDSDDILTPNGTTRSFITSGTGGGESLILESTKDDNDSDDDIYKYCAPTKSGNEDEGEGDLDTYHDDDQIIFEDNDHEYN